MMFAAIEAIEDAGDRAFLLSLYQEYHLLMFATARKYLSSQADCEDVVQSSLEQLIKHVDTLRELPHYTMISYITATVRNTAFNLLDDEAKLSSRFVPLEESQEGEPPPGPITADEMMLLLHRRELISRVMEALSPGDRMLLEGKYIMGYSDRELARQLNCRETAIRMRLSRARHRAMNLILTLEGSEV